MSTFAILYAFEVFSASVVIEVCHDSGVSRAFLFNLRLV